MFYIVLASIKICSGILMVYMDIDSFIEKQILFFIAIVYDYQI